jgi:tRNA A37 threonylcarbamoyladenosine synthetase subunit TsaC/SUA5/YrdC
MLLQTSQSYPLRIRYFIAVLSSFVPRPGTDIRLVGSKGPALKWQTAADGTVAIAMPDLATVQNLSHAWVLKATKAKRGFV